MIETDSSSSDESSFEKDLQICDIETFSSSTSESENEDDM